ncbi:ALI_collapsed_G0052200.mRNA.1.CDS.1 [Saccharomyces cerevisiae]|nr:ALI_collapsed_G0052200.mRNA.1.CDS.1 [Saccharomyces cerevisiae]
MSKRGSLQDRASPSEETVKKAQKRRKPIKSCAFCRKRKLRCDQQKPMCSTCKTRGRSGCLYTEKFTHKIETKELFGSTPNIELLKRIEDLEKRLDDKELTEKDVALSRSPFRNPYANFYYLQCKGSGRRIVYGPTSLRTHLSNDDNRFVNTYNQLWSKVKIERNRWKARHKWTMKPETQLLEGPPLENTGSDILQQVCNVLPSFEQSSKIITDFFNTELETNEVSEVLDKTKIINDFTSSFLPSDELLPNGERRIEKLLPSTKKNYYKIGVILMILCIRHFYKNTPEEIEKFLIMLTGLSTAKVYFIERAQFLLLKYYHRELIWACGDDSHMISLVDLLCSTAIMLGLHLNIREIYKNQENIVGSMESLENLWVWIILSDFNVSLNIGRCLAINSSYFQVDECENGERLPKNTNNYSSTVFFDQSNSCMGKLKRFLRLARPMLDQIYDRSAFPDLAENCKKLRNFVETEFHPISYYTDSELISKVPLREIKVLAQVLNLLLTFYSLRYLIYKEKSVVLENNILQTILVSFSLVINTTILCFNLDEKHFPEFFHHNCVHLPPFMALSLVYTNFLFPRASTGFCAFLYHKLTLFEKGYYLSSNIKDQEVTDWDLSTLNIPLDKAMNLLTAFKIHSDIFAKWSNDNNKQLRIIMARSYTFVINIALESIYRAVLEKVIKYRTEVENTCLQQLQDELNGSYSLTDNVNTLIDPSLSDLGVTSASPLAGNSPGLPPEEVRNNSENASHNNETGPIGTELAQTISNEFWTAYNLGWEELMSQPDYKYLFDTQ